MRHRPYLFSSDKAVSPDSSGGGALGRGSKSGGFGLGRGGSGRRNDSFPIKKIAFRQQPVVVEDVNSDSDKDGAGAAKSPNVDDGEGLGYLLPEQIQAQKEKKEAWEREVAEEREAGLRGEMIARM